MKSMKLMGSIIASAILLSLSGKTLATEDHNPPKPPQPVGTSAPVTQTQTVGVGVEQNVLQQTDVDVGVGVNVKVPVTVNPTTIIKGGPTNVTTGPTNVTTGPTNVTTGPTNVTVNQGANNIQGSTSSSTIADGAVRNTVTGGTSSVTGSGNSTNTNDNRSSATGGNVTGSGNSSATGGTVAGSGNSEVKIDSHDKNVNVNFVPPSTPSLAPAPVIQECTACRIDFSFSSQEISGSTTTVEPQVIKGKDLLTDKDSYLTLTSMSAFTGVAKKPTGVRVLLATANRVPPETNFAAVAMITAQADGKNAHKVTLEELQIRVLQAARRLKFSSETAVYVVCSRKATTLHPTLVTTGKGFSFAPGLAGEVLGGLGGLSANLGRSSGTATNDFTPEISCIVLKPNTVGVKGELVGALDYQATQAVSVNK